MTPSPVGLDSLAIGLVTLLIVGYAAFVLLVVLGGWVVMGFALMSLFRKVGVKPWVAWVPYYRTWVWLELGGQPGWLSLLSLIGGGFVTSVFLYLGMWRVGLAFRKDAGFFVLGIFLPWLWAFLLGGRSSVYEPGLLAWYGFPPPRVGYGSVVVSSATTPAAAPGQWPAPAPAPAPGPPAGL